MINEFVSQAMLNNAAGFHTENNAVARSIGTKEAYLAGVSTEEKDARRIGYGTGDFATSICAQGNIRGAQTTYILNNLGMNILVPGTPLLGERTAGNNYNQTIARPHPVVIGPKVEAAVIEHGGVGGGNGDGGAYNFKMEKLDPSPTSGFDVPAHWPPYEGVNF